MGADHGTQFSVETREVDSRVRVSASGELDVATAPKLEDAIVAAVALGRAVDLDLQQVGFLDSTGLRAVIGGLRRAREAEVDFSLVATSPAVDRLLRITGLDNEF